MSSSLRELYLQNIYLLDKHVHVKGEFVEQKLKRVRATKDIMCLSFRGTAYGVARAGIR